MTDAWQAINTALLIVLALVQAALAKRHAQKQREIREVAKSGVQEIVDTLKDLERERLRAELEQSRREDRRTEGW